MGKLSEVDKTSVVCVSCTLYRVSCVCSLQDSTHQELGGQVTFSNILTTKLKPTPKLHHLLSVP